MYHDNAYTISIYLNKKIDCSAPILFIPRGAQTTSTIIKPVTTKVTPTLKPLPKKAPTTLAMATMTSKTVITQQQSQEKSVQTPAVAKPETINPKVEKPLPTPLINKEISPITKPDTPKENIQEPIATHCNQQKIGAPRIPENAQISDNYKEVEALRRHAQLHNEIIKQWKQPLGAPPTCTCDISFFVNKKGKIENLTIKKSSGVLMYDISARQALYSMNMPQWTYGKQLIINFK